ncbi:hypothetical protein CRI94_09700 [Longibacter salinarum]|uniref:DUF4359 domain-containing protein n=1 Tax=Longibacter salinarum TaxID=1850348 RepID=A0A2A8CY97_9BACT|nr:DUF4359 domain-containing protein [Longibacter salinarum]PEN13574.1 hypothetical protein CRI94_09700 [Longibacter salinarum]
MKKLLGLLLVAFVLFLVNPGMNDFSTFFKERSSDRIEQETGGGLLGRVLGGAGSELLAAGVEEATTRRSYLVCSTYDVDPDGDDVAEYRYLGVAGMFVTLREPEK